MWEQYIGKAGFSLDRLVTLCRVADHGGIMAAARQGIDERSPGAKEAVANRQTQYSRQIAELEAFFGGEDRLALLDRSRRPYRLNEEGERLARLARGFFAGLEDFLADQGSVRNRLVIGAGERHIQWLLFPEMLPVLRKRFPATGVIFLNRQTQDIVKGLRDGELDLGLLRLSALEGTGLRWAGSWRESYQFFIPGRMRPKLPAEPGMADVAVYPLAVLEGSGDTKAALLRLFEGAGARPNIQLECSSLPQVAQAVESKEFCAFLPEFARSRLPSGDIAVHRIPGLEALDQEFKLAWNPERADFRPLLRQAVEVLTGR